VLINNDGGGIFHFLPVATQRDHFTEHVATPHGVEFARLGVAHELARSAAEFAAAYERALAAPGVAIVEVRTDRDANVTLHRQVWEAVARSVRDAA
jgi:2-succinyl-5-enolpyruvyl-6-hydroxy-3-cyclohexene-1-carboxylate synthase